MKLLETALATLSKNGAIFCSEADFQHALGWEIHLLDPTAKVNLEYPVSMSKGPNGIKSSVTHIDGLVRTRDESEYFAFELKYKTATFLARNHGFYFELRHQGAADFAWYDFWKDVKRLEFLKNHSYFTEGYALMLTNDRYIWSGPRNNHTSGVQFSLNSIRKGPGILKWGKTINKSTLGGRHKSIELSREYKIEWHDFCSFNDKNGQFRYLLVKV